MIRANGDKLNILRLKLIDSSLSRHRTRLYFCFCFLHTFQKQAKKKKSMPSSFSLYFSKPPLTFLMHFKSFLRAWALHFDFLWDKLHLTLGLVSYLITPGPRWQIKILSLLYATTRSWSCQISWNKQNKLQSVLQMEITSREEWAQIFWT